MGASRVPARRALFVWVVTLGAALVLGVAPSAQAACQWLGIDGTNS